MGKDETINELKDKIRKYSNQMDKLKKLSTNTKKET
jgi:hypothetical protein